MPDPTLIIAELNANEIKLVGELVKDVSTENRFYAFIQVNHDGTAQRPTNHQLRKVTDSLNERGLMVVFVLIENDRGDILANAKSMLIRSFPDVIRNVFPTFGNRGVIIWIEPKKILETEQAAAIKIKLEEFLTFLESSLQEFYLTSAENVPTRTACLNSIRLYSPLSQGDLHTRLVKRGFHIPSDEWLSNMLDKLRKADFILRSKSGQFTLTLRGLKALGSAKNRNSPDIMRALDMARRGA